jgi:methylphosphotriester-DNA--protein-cysteine methyltransferase
MGYNLIGLFGKVEARLSEDPGTRLFQLEKELRVDRHTIEKAVRRASGISFRDLQRRKLLAEVLRLLSLPNMSLEEIAATLGYRSFDSLSQEVSGRPCRPRARHRG